MLSPEKHDFILVFVLLKNCEYLMISRGTGPTVCNVSLYSGPTSGLYCEPMNVPPPTQSNPILPPVKHFPLPTTVPDLLSV